MRAITFSAVIVLVPVLASAQQPCTSDADSTVDAIYRQVLERASGGEGNARAEQLRSGQTSVREIVRDVAVHFHFHLIEIVNQVLLVRDPLQERGLIVRHQRAATLRPAIAMHEAEVGRRDPIDEGHVATHDGFFDLLLELNDCTGVSRGAVLSEDRRGPRGEDQRDDHEPARPVEKSARLHSPRSLYGTTEIAVYEPLGVMSMLCALMISLAFASRSCAITTSRNSGSLCADFNRLSRSSFDGYARM